MLTHHVLIVEDDGDIRDGLVDFLEDHGYTPVGARDGREALVKLAALDPRPCVIILDLMMPVMDGRAFREEQIRSSEWLQIPVVVISAYKDVAEAAKDLNVAAHLPKPLNLIALLQVMRQLCAPA